MPPQRPHLKMSVQRDPRTGKLATVEQGTAQHVLSQETSVALCPIGFRLERKDFGWPQSRSRGIPIDPRPLVDALNRLVPTPFSRSAEAYANLAVDPAAWGIEVDTEVQG